MMIEKEMQAALESHKPIDALKKIAMQLKKQGMDNKNIYDIFYIYYSKIDDANITKDILGDFMDMITGWYQERKIEL